MSAIGWALIGMLAWNHPCGLCGKPVKSNQAGIQCDVCQLWLHIKCLGMPMKTYGDLQVSDESWGCPSCYCSSLPFAECSRINSTLDSSSTSCSSASSGCTVVSSAGLKLYYCNCRSLLPKLDELKIMIQSEKPDLLAFTETWLHPGIAESEVCLEGYHLFRHDRDGHGGGVALYVGESISVSKVGRSVKLEFMSVVLSLKSGPLRCVCITDHLAPTVHGTYWRLLFRT